MTHEELRKQHFERLQDYRNSVEYARQIGEVPKGDRPHLVGNRWEIDREIYDEALNVLPPMGWRGDTFFMSEFTFGDVTAKFSKDGDRYFCEFAHYPERRVSVATPWGMSDSMKEYAPGIVFYGTPSHGGFHLSEARVAEMPAPLREFVPFAGHQKGPGRWFEEDADWSVVALAFPQFFSDDAVDAAGRILKSYRPEVYEAFEALPRTEVQPVEMTEKARKR